MFTRARSQRSRRRRLAGLVGAALAVAVAGQLVGATPALADSGTPVQDTKVVTTVNPDGTVTATMSGTWTWDQRCAIDFGTDWAVDWWGISSSPLPVDNFALTNATQVPGPAATTRGSVVSVGSQRIHGWLAGLGGSDDSYFHVGRYFAGEDVHSTGTCTDVGWHSSTGSWSAEATYPSAAVVPAQLCVLMYDPGGFGDHPSPLPSSYDPTRNWDNSITNHDFDPTPGAGYCVSTDVPPPPPAGGNGYVELCPTAQGDGVDGAFTFTFAGQRQTIPVGSCGPAVRVPEGPLVVTQEGRPGFALGDVTTRPKGRLVSRDKSTFTVRVVPGGVRRQTLVNVGEKRIIVAGTPKVCQATGPDVPAGTEFSFTSAAGTVTVPAGSCQVLGTFGGRLTITQSPSPTVLSAITVAPKNRLVSRDRQARAVTVEIGKVVTDVTFTNTDQ